MICPFCGKEMKKGILSGDGRSKVRWKSGDKKTDIWDALSDSGSVTAVKYTLTAFTVEWPLRLAMEKTIIFMM